MLSYYHSTKKARNRCGMKLNRVVKYVALLVVGFVAFGPSDVPGEGRKLASGYTETITTESGEKVSFKMVLVPGGTFLMGSPENEPGRKDDEGPQHDVSVSPFYICTTETTLELFLAYYQEMVTASRDDVDATTHPTPVYGDLTMGYSKKHPAIGMTWHNAMTFCKWLSIKTGRKYCLPTEAEWEYACRAGTINVFGFGNDQNQLKDYAWYEANSDGETHEVGKKKPDPWGIYDMLGNVCEWVYDFYSPTTYKESAVKSPAVNPKGPKTGNVHVARGGDYSCSIGELRCAGRLFEEKWWRSGDPQIPKSKWWLPSMDFIGFRIARSVDPNDQSMGKGSNPTKTH